MPENKGKVRRGLYREDHGDVAVGDGAIQFEGMSCRDYKREGILPRYEDLPTKQQYEEQERRHQS
jgi:hypothetical protein